MGPSWGIARRARPPAPILCAMDTATARWIRGSPTIPCTSRPGGSRGAVRGPRGRRRGRGDRRPPRPGGPRGPTVQPPRRSAPRGLPGGAPRRSPRTPMDGASSSDSSDAPTRSCTAARPRTRSRWRASSATTSRRSRTRTIRCSDALPRSLAAELVGIRPFPRAFVALAGGGAAALAYAFVESKSWLDVSIDTLSAFRRSGFGTSAAAALMADGCARGCGAVWGAEPHNAASAGARAPPRPRALRRRRDPRRGRLIWLRAGSPAGCRR